jgi:NAD(P)-dependent dehydrogenase (short-subunit alcohol dehydrogenase family)
MESSPQACLVTGHTSGIGLALTKILCERSIKCYGASRSKSTLVLPSSNQICTDLSTEDGLFAASDFARANHITSLVHCAGFNSIKPLNECSITDFLSAYYVHCVSAAFIGNVIAQSTSPGTPISLIFLSSIWSLRACHSRTCYAMAKSALNVLARQFAVEHPLLDMFSISLSLGFVNTPLTARSSTDNFLVPFRQRMLLGSNDLATPDEIAQFIFTLLTQRPRYLNASTLDLSGGILSQ